MTRNRDSPIPESFASRDLSRRAQKTFQRWTDIRIEQFGYVNNLALTLAVAIVVLTPNVSRGPGLTLVQWALLAAGVAAAVVSVVFGLLAAVTRLLDFRKTTEVARREWSMASILAGALAHGADQGKPIASLELENQGDRNRALRLSARAWPLLWWQMGLLLASVLLMAAFGAAFLFGGTAR